MFYECDKSSESEKKKKKKKKNEKKLPSESCFSSIFEIWPKIGSYRLPTNRCADLSKCVP